MRKILKWGAIAFVGLIVIAALAGGSDDKNTQSDTASDNSQSVANNDTTAEPEATPDETPAPVDPNPDGTYKLNCDYVLGDFGDSGDSAQGFRFIGGGNIENTGNIGIVARVTFTWEQLGADPIRDRRNVRLAVGKKKRLKVSIPASSDQIDLHQSADGDCSTKVKIVDTFGQPQS